MDARMPARLPLLRLPLLIVLLALSGLLLAAGAAHATPVPLSPIPLSLEALAEDEGEEEDWEGEEEEETECEAARQELAEGELSQREAEEACTEDAREERRGKAGSSGAAPEACVLRSAHASATTPGDDKLKLTIGYTTYDPGAATLQIGHFAAVHHHLGRSGVLRLVESLHGRNAPKRLAVRIEIAGARSTGCPFRRLVLTPR
jgi:hypothetical protein